LVSLQKEFSRALTRQRILYDSITANFPQQNEQPGLDELKQKATHLKQTIVSYFMGKKTVYQLIISAEKTTFVKLTDSEEVYNKFVQTIRAYNHFFNDPETINNDIAAFASVSNNLYRQLQIPKAENLIIIPDGILTFVPFQTLLTHTSKTFQYGKMPFLVFKSNVSYSISFQAYIKDSVPFSEKQSVLGVFPVFKNTPQELGYSIFEAEAIEDVFPAKMLMEKQATAAAFLENADSYSILHISTHARGGTFSSEPSIEFSDRTLSLEELYGLQFSNQLVILSACDTGVGKVMKGEGALSLARGFQYAGAPNVLFSLWQVNDKSTAQLMTYYYRNLKKIRSRNQALHRASLDYLNDETIDNTRKSPYYWGAFVYYGTTDAPLEHSRPNWYIIGILALLVLVLVLWLAKKRKIRFLNQ
jgi:CHAT domain-containing protein